MDCWETICSVSIFSIIVRTSLETIDCSLEARVDESGSEICRGGHSTLVRPFPIGIDFDEHAELAESDEVANQMRRWRRELSLSGKLLGIGIDRLDYTKGIPERLRSLDRLLEEDPQYRGKLVFVQIAVPSRSSLPAYRQIEQEVDYLTAQINRRWGTALWRPITLLKRHYTPPEMIALHRLAQFCVVTSLHDGMNLVAKEFVASRVDEDGVLVLSKFAGAAHEMKDALQSIRSQLKNAPMLIAKHCRCSPRSADAACARCVKGWNTIMLPVGWKIPVGFGEDRVSGTRRSRGFG